MNNSTNNNTISSDKEEGDYNLDFAYDIGDCTTNLSKYLEPIQYVLDNVKCKLINNNASYVANANISEYISEDDVAKIQLATESAMELLLKSLLIDTENDHNTQETAKRVAKMFVREVYKGRYEPKPSITVFPNISESKDMYTLGPIDFKSACSHHLVPIIGKCWVGVIPGEEVIGISKINRLVEWVARRPHIQEEAITILKEELIKSLKPAGIYIIIKAKHMCMTWRGVNQESTSMVSSSIEGIFKYNPEAKREFLELIKGQGYCD